MLEGAQKARERFLVGRDLARGLGIAEGDALELKGAESRVAILESGTKFDSFIKIQVSQKH